MTDVQLQQKLSNSNVATIWIYQSTNNNGVVLYILNYNGHELARKEYNTRSGGWDDTTDPKMWFYPLPNNANDIDVHPIGDLIIIRVYRLSFIVGSGASPNGWRDFSIKEQTWRTGLLRLKA